MTTISATTPTTVTSTRHAGRSGTDPMRRIALAGGLLYLLTFAASLPQLKLFANLVHDPEGFVMGRGSNTAVLLGSWLEVVTALAGIGTAVVLYPVTRRISATAAIGFVTSRAVEASLIIVGVVSLLAVVTLRADLASTTGARADALSITGHALVELRQRTFLLGPGLMAGVNDLLLGYLLYRSRLVPRTIATIGLVGGPLMLASTTGTIFGLWDQVSGPALVLGLPVFIFELAVGGWLTVKGFQRAGVDTLGTAAAGSNA
jgi:hypothetical protein